MLVAESVDRRFFDVSDSFNLKNQSPTFLIYYQHLKVVINISRLKRCHQHRCGRFNSRSGSKCNAAVVFPKILVNQNVHDEIDKFGVKMEGK